MVSRIRSALAWAVDTYVLFVVLGILLGAAFAPMAMDATTGPDGTVAVVPIQGTIDGQQAAQYQAMMAEAQAEADAVVIVANSGGGSATASESMYMQTVRTNASIPVVASVDGVAASGAYYAIAPAEDIYVKPASFIGSVGVVATVPPEVEPNNVIGATGPNKLEAFGERRFFNSLETSRNAFVGSVMEQRGDRIQLTENEVAMATVFGGSHAVENGMADAIGDRRTAIRAAAERAGLSQPEITVITPADVAGGQDAGWTATYALEATYHAGTADERRFEPIRTADTPRQGSFPTLLMAHPGAVEASQATLVTLDSDGTVARAGSEGRGPVANETAGGSTSSGGDDGENEPAGRVTDGLPTAATGVRA